MQVFDVFLMKDHDVLKHFAQSLGSCQYRQLSDLCEEHQISFPEVENFDGVLIFLNGPAIPIEHTTTRQNRADPCLFKISSGQKMKNITSSENSDLFSETRDVVQKKHQKSEGYAQCVAWLNKHGVLCSKRGVLFVERYDPYKSGLYEDKQFRDEVSLLKSSILLERPDHQPSFFKEICYGAWVYSAFGDDLTLRTELIYG